MRRFIISLASALAAVACQSSTEPAGRQLLVASESLSVSWGDTVSLRVTGASMPAGPVDWSSSDTSVATVDATGIVTGRRGGAATISATAGSVIRSAIVVVDMRFVSLAVGDQRTCGLTRRGRAVCWGQNGGGLGVAGTDDQLLPAVVSRSDGSEAGPYVELVAGLGWYGTFAATSGALTCARTARGRVDCWGGRYFGEQGTGVISFDPGAPDSVRLSGPAASVRPGGMHACAITVSGDGFCWGANEFGQLGVVGQSTCTGYNPHNSFDCTAVPAIIASAIRFKEIAAGDVSTCGVDFDGRVFCWGAALATPNLNGPSHGVTPQPVVLGAAAHGVVVGGRHACALTTQGDALCWGDNSHGQLGRGTTDSTRAPALVSGGLHFASLAAGLNTTCGVATSGDAYCWGDNRSGQIGDATTADRSVPARVGVTSPIAGIWTAETHTCALATDGAAYCWGRGLNGEIGNGLRTGSTIPLRVAPPA